MGETVRLQCYKCGFVYDETLADGEALGRIGNGQDVFNEFRRNGFLKGRKADWGGIIAMDLVCPNCHDIYDIQKFVSDRDLSDKKVALNRVLRGYQDRLDGKKQDGKSSLERMDERFRAENRTSIRLRGRPIVAFETGNQVVFDVIPGPFGEPMPLTMPYTDYADPGTAGIICGSFKRSLVSGDDCKVNYCERMELEFAPWDESYCFVDARRTLEQLLEAIYGLYPEKLLSYVLRKSPAAIGTKAEDLLLNRSPLHRWIRRRLPNMLRAGIASLLRASARFLPFLRGISRRLP
jgi:hypothetical protein